MIKVYRRTGGGRPPHPLAPVIGAIYKGTIANAMRSQRRRRRLIGDAEPSSDRMPSSQTPERLLHEAEEDLQRERDIVAIFDEMDPEDLELILLTRGRGVPLKDIAEFFDCPLGTIASRLSRARRDLLARYQRRKLSRR
jgi:RNA polymerase sigma-70 factor (ECF subfamily)